MVKRLAAQTNLYRPYEHQIMTPFQLYQWAIDDVPGVHFCNCSTEEYERQKIFLQTRFEQTRTIPGMRKLHSFIPISKNTLRTRIYSSSSITREDRVTKLPGDLEQKEVSGFVTFSQERTQDFGVGGAEAAQSAEYLGRKSRPLIKSHV